jgi:hypothetical protein
MSSPKTHHETGNTQKGQVKGLSRRSLVCSLIVMSGMWEMTVIQLADITVKTTHHW